MTDTRPKQFLVGIQNSEGEEYFHCNGYGIARDTIENFLDEGHCESDIVVYQAIPVKVDIQIDRQYDIQFQEE